MHRRKHRKVHNFLVPINKKLENGKAITYKINFIGSFRFMSCSWSNLVDNLVEGLHNHKCIDCRSCLEHISTRDEFL